ATAESPCRCDKDYDGPESEYRYGSDGVQTFSKRIEDGINVAQSTSKRTQAGASSTGANDSTNINTSTSTSLTDDPGLAAVVDTGMRGLEWFVARELALLGIAPHLAYADTLDPKDTSSPGDTQRVGGSSKGTTDGTAETDAGDPKNRTKGAAIPGVESGLGSGVEAGVVHSATGLGYGCHGDDVIASEIRFLQNELRQQHAYNERCKEK
ncbi:hypothetical protein SARC_17348, partial [Sphaeroforma arctica JP610]